MRQQMDDIEQLKQMISRQARSQVLQEYRKTAEFEKEYDKQMKQEMNNVHERVVNSVLEDYEMTEEAEEAMQKARVLLKRCNPILQPQFPFPVPESE